MDSFNATLSIVLKKLVKPLALLFPILQLKYLSAASIRIDFKESEGNIDKIIISDFNSDLKINFTTSNNEEIYSNFTFLF